MKEIIATVTTVAALTITALIAVLGVTSCVAYEMSLPSQLAQIEQLRKDSSNVDPAQAEDVIGQVTQWNQRIASNQAFNKTWWAGWAIPDAWDDIEPISVPQ
jgi:hypothetical protein